VPVTPDIAAGSGFTVIRLLVKQPAGIVYEIVDEPVVTPETTPDEEPMAATSGFVLIHVPPAGTQDNVTADPVHTAVPPVITVGVALTVTAAMFLQPVEVSVNVTGAVPADTPFTMPLTEPIVATPAAPLDQVPAPVASVIVMVFPVHKGTLPDGAAGAVRTVTVVVALAPQEAV